MAGFTTIISNGQPKTLITIINNKLPQLTSTEQDWTVQTHNTEAQLESYLTTEGIDYTQTYKKAYVKI